jgi:rhodanese-related sulfurtransferase
MMIRYMLCASLSSWLLIACGGGDRMVESRAYDALLRQLVPKSAPVLGVKAAARRDDLQYLDARAREEYEVSHLPQARWVGYDTFDSSQVATLDPQQPLLVYCSVGYRSGKIAETLQQMGFQEVYNLYGGLFEWANQGLPLYDAQEQPTDSVHGYSRSWGIWVKKGEVVYPKK